jgi:hypothetical protein
MMDKLKNIVDNTLVPHSAFQAASTRLEQCFKNADGASEPVGIAVIGDSRTGKSRALEECATRHPQVRTPEGLSVPILRVKTPSKPTVKGLVEVMLRALNDPRFDRGTEQARTGRLETLMCGAGTRMVMIDEFQHFYDKGSHKVMHHVADWLKIIVDDTKVALVVAGLPSCGAVLDQNEQLAGRFLSPIRMPRFDWKIDAHREEFLGILGAFHESLTQSFDLPALDSPDMAFRCYCGTGGLIGYLTKFLRQAVWNAIDEARTRITLEDLALAHDQSVWSRDGLSDVESPFSRGFAAMPSENLLAKISRIGTPADEVINTRSRRPMASRKMTASDVLVAA